MGNSSLDPLLASLWSLSVLKDFETNVMLENILFKFLKISKFIIFSSVAKISPRMGRKL